MSHDAGRELPSGCWDDVLEGLARVEAAMGMHLGDAANPLLLSVRSGAAVSYCVWQAMAASAMPYAVHTLSLLPQPSASSDLLPDGLMELTDVHQWHCMQGRTARFWSLYACWMPYAAVLQFSQRLWFTAGCKLRGRTGAAHTRLGHGHIALAGLCQFYKFATSLRDAGCSQVSMPGMMDTVLNLGLNDTTAAGLATRTGNERFAYDAYRRFLDMCVLDCLAVMADQ
jgi:hypothetical protein